MPLVFTQPSSSDVLVLDPIIPVGDPALCWALDSANGATDLSGNGMGGTGEGSIAIGGLTDAPNGWNGSTDFDGTDDFVSASYSPYGADDFTFVGWANRDDAGEIHTIFSGDGAASAPLFDITTAQDVRFSVIGNDGAATSRATWASAWPGNAQWVHVALVFSPADDEATLYINGAAESTVSGLTAAYSTPGNFQIGAHGAGPSNHFDGKMASVAVYERLLTAGEIASDYERGASRLHKRSELNLSPWVKWEGIDWGDAAIEQYLSEGKVGSVPVSHRTPNRQIRVPLVLRDKDGVTWEEIRSALAARVGLTQQEGGTLRRGPVTDPLFADVVNATLSIPDTGLAELKGFDADAILTLEAIPDFYGHEEDKGLEAGSATAGQTIHTSTDVGGDSPGRMRALIENTAAVAKFSVFYALRSRVRGDDTDAMVIEGEDITPEGGSTVVADAEGTGGQVLSNTAVGTSFISMGNFFASHVGPHRVLVRMKQVASDITMRLNWTQGASAVTDTNSESVLLDTPGWQILDLGAVNPRQAPTGVGGWTGFIDIKADAASGNSVRIDRIFVLPTGQGYGRIFSEGGLDAAVYAEETAELRTDGFWREVSDTFAPIVVEGTLPRMPGDGRDVELLIKLLGPDGDNLDNTIHAPAVRVLHRPSYLFPPR